MIAFEIAHIFWPTLNWAYIWDKAYRESLEKNPTLLTHGSYLNKHIVNGGIWCYAPHYT